MWKINVFHLLPINMRLGNTYETKNISVVHLISSINLPSRSRRFTAPMTPGKTKFCQDSFRHPSFVYNILHHFSRFDKTLWTDRVSLRRDCSFRSWSISRTHVNFDDSLMILVLKVIEADITYFNMQAWCFVEDSPLYGNFFPEFKWHSRWFSEWCPPG